MEEILKKGMELINQAYGDKKTPEMAWTPKEFTEPKPTTAEMWYTYFKENGKVYRYLRVKVGEIEICFPAEHRPQLAAINEKALERINQDAWSERTLSQPLPTTWMKTGL